MINKTKNKRGDIPITILVIGVILVCLTAIIGFSIASDMNLDVDTVKGAKLIAEKAEVYKKIGLNQNEIDNILGIKSDDGRYILIQGNEITVRYDLP